MLIHLYCVQQLGHISASGQWAENDEKWQREVSEISPNWGNVDSITGITGSNFFPSQPCMCSGCFPMNVSILLYIKGDDNCGKEGGSWTLLKVIFYFKQS